MFQVYMLQSTWHSLQEPNTFQTPQTQPARGPTLLLAVHHGKIPNRYYYKNHSNTNNKKINKELKQIFTHTYTYTYLYIYSCVYIYI